MFRQHRGNILHRGSLRLIHRQSVASSVDFVLELLVVLLGVCERRFCRCNFQLSLVRGLLQRRLVLGGQLRSRCFSLFEHRFANKIVLLLLLG